ncbi:hypothetical protein [Finegoldia magna]|uniref:hypothetical protein n=1 Tax=Finegoldia magna TaxID=1260 RepID=UPI00399B9A34
MDTKRFEHFRKLDGEKMNVLEHLGFERIRYVDICKFRNTLEDDRDGKEIFMWYANMPTRTKGPSKVDSLYLRKMFHKAW